MKKAAEITGILIIVAIIAGYFTINLRDCIKMGDSTKRQITEKSTQNENMEENVKMAYLTFDDGPSENTPKVLEILEKYDVKATFFIIGSQITDDYKSQIKQMEKNGHCIGIHTYSHKYNQIYLSKEEYIKDFDRAYNMLCGILDTSPVIFRFPGGSCNCYIGSRKKEIVSELKKRGFSYYDWNVSGEDSVGKPDANKIFENVKKDVKTFEKPVILLHDSSINEETVKALPKIIEYIKEQGYLFDTLN